MNATKVNVTYSTATNIYKYNSSNLIISYAIAIWFTLFSLLLGLYAFLDNGVVHSTEFSAIMATTRNPALNSLSEGHSLGTISLNKGIQRVKLMFGVLEEGQDKVHGVSRIGFGLQDNVTRLKKGGKYV